MALLWSWEGMWLFMSEVTLKGATRDVDSLPSHTPAREQINALNPYTLNPKS